MKKFLKRICAAFWAVSMLIPSALALDPGKVVTPFDMVLYQIERYGLFAEGHEMSDAERAICNARIDGGESLSTVVNEILEKHDSHSFYLSASEYKESFSSLTDEYVGIGISVQLMDGDFIITAVNYGGPAREAGVQTGDTLLAINGTPVKGQSIDDLTNLIRGTPGSEVTLKLGRTGREIELTVTRREIYGDYVWSKTLAEGIEYIRVEAFGSTTDAEHFIDIWETLDDKRTGAVILDLRGNGGGVIAAGLAMLDEILTEPVEMVTCRWRSDNGGDQAATSKGGGLPLNGLYVLVDENTASAAEMMAACIKDAGAGELIGEKTYGKSLGQFHLSLTNGDTLVITTLEMRTPKTGVWEGKGVVPDKQTASIVTVDDYLKGKEPLSAVRPLIFGETGSQVTALTERLHLLGLLDETGDTLTAEVMKAVHIFQAASDLPESIQVDIATQKKLNEMMNQVSDYYVDNALEEAMLLAQEAAEQPLKYTPHADGSWAA